MADKKTEFPTRPSLVGEKIYLRPATPEDAVNFEYWAMHSEPDIQSCFPLPFLTPSEASEQFKSKQRSMSEQWFAILRKDDQMLTGAAMFFNYNPLNRSAEFGILIDPEERRKGHGKEAAQLLCRYLFRYRGLNKVFLQTVAFNKAAIKLLEGLGFKRDADLRDHYFYNGEFHDGVIYSLPLFDLDW